MRHFTISFYHRGKRHNAAVQKISIHPIQFIVYNVHPYISKLPNRLVFISNEKEDQLVYQSFDIAQEKTIREIGETVFKVCNMQKIAVHA